MEGWLYKRGPTKQFKWQRRWCVLRPESFEYYEEGNSQVAAVASAAVADARASLTGAAGKVSAPSSSNGSNFLDFMGSAGKEVSSSSSKAAQAIHQSKKCGSIQVRPNTRAVHFSEQNAPGESPKYVNERQFGFCFDVDPDDGPSRRLYYFDPESKESMEAWVRAIEAAAAKLIKLTEGDVLMVVQPFASDSSSEISLGKGDTGTVMRLDDDGDALIDFHKQNKQLWVYCSKFVHLEKLVEKKDKRVSLELIPQDQVIMHWAIRVGTGATSLCYEFEFEGVKIGRTSALHRGYPMEVRPLTGRTSKTHKEIKAWVVEFDKMHEYSIDGSTFGGRNCQDFSVELLEFLEINTEQMPWKQAAQVKVALGAGMIAADVALGTGVAFAAADMAMGAGAAVAGVALAPEVMAIAVGAAAAGFAYGMYTEAASED